MDSTIPGLSGVILHFLSNDRETFVDFLSTNGCGDEAPQYAVIIEGALENIRQNTGTFGSSVDAVQLHDYLDCYREEFVATLAKAWALNEEDAEHTVHELLSDLRYFEEED